MCGIAGLWEFGGARAEALERTGWSMLDRLAHRGPDDRGLWTDVAAGVALGNRRLAIVDLSPGGHQPMASADGRVVVAFNGEIYNHAEVRRALEAEGRTFRSRSDTEVLVEAVAAWGLDRALAALNGMFALALWFTAERRLVLVRDPLGEKPLYWSLAAGRLLFGSELKALRVHPGFPAEIDRGALAEYLRRSFIPAPLTAYAGVRQLEPGTLLEIDAGGACRQRRYWSVEAVARAGLADPLDLGEEEAVEAAEALLADAVASRMVADVPLGVFLSGGIDSAVVAALMRRASAGPVRSFSIGFEEASHDESAAAATAARALGTDHTAFTLTAADAARLVPELPGIYDEPFADSSQVPTLMLCRLARRSVTVALSGDGGDEVFAGYSRHLWAGRLDRLRRLPGPLRGALGLAAGAVPAGAWELAERLPGAPRTLGDKAAKAALALGAADDGDLYRRMAARWPRPAGLLRGAPGGGAWADPEPPEGLDAAARVQFRDFAGYLPSGVLVKLDRASMAASLEARVPLLDPRVVAFGWRLPARLRLRDGRGKWLLRRVLARHLPPAHAERPKSGFGVPLAAWLAGPLRGWAEDLLDPAAIAAGGLLDPAPVRAAWSRLLAGRGAWAEPLWTVLMLEAWRRQAP
ncbi:MAG TPA: asparagine synthase (glutamine-hydrolyzing) [Azospirillaceae bacterium]|nr:asparagine synthase (glutamine-hydrolyzing) [Azospirillaceae bacterium]